MPVKIELSNFTGNPDKVGWTQILDFQPHENLAKDERFLAILGVRSEQINLGNSINNVFLGRSILSTLKNKYYEKDSSDSPGNHSKIKKAIGEVLKEFGGFERMEIAVAIFVNNTVYVSSGGGAFVSISRNNHLVPLVATNSHEVSSASGRVENGDVILLGTSSFFEKYKTDSLKTFLVNRNLDEFTRSLSSLGKEVDGDVGILCAQFISDEEKVAEEFISSSGDVFQNPLETGKNLSFKNLKENFSGLLRRISEKKLYVASDETPEASKKRKGLAIAGAVLLFALLGSITFGISQKREADRKNSYQKELTEAKHSLTEAENLIELNPERARELFVEGREKVLGLSSEGVDDPELTELANIIDSSQGKILGEYKTNTEVFLDLGLLSSGFNGDEISVSNGNFFVLDTNGKRISKTSISTKRSEIIAGPSVVNQVDGFTTQNNEVYILNSEGVFSVSGEKKKVSDEVFNGDFLVQAYTGNLYVLEKSQSVVWRMPGSGDVFGDKKAWLKEDQVVDLTSAKSWTIDGQIWIATGGSIYRFGAGNRINFKATSVDEFNADSIYTDETSNSLYVLDATSGRILMFTKEGEYELQYISEDIKNASKFAVFEDEKKIILLKGDKLLSIELKHL